MKKEKTKIRSPHLRPYFIRRIGFVLLGLWLFTMSLLTVGTAQYVLRELVETSEEVSAGWMNVIPLRRGRCPSPCGRYPAAWTTACWM